MNEITLDIFNNDAFSAETLTALYNNRPPVMGQIGKTLDFEEDSISTEGIGLESMDGTLALVEPSPRGGPGEVIDHDKRKILNLRSAHFQRDDSVTASELQGVRAYGSSNVLEDVQSVIDRKMARHARDLDLTDEWLKFGVINGRVLSGQGKIVLDIYKAFEITPPALQSIELNNAGCKVRLIADELRVNMEDDLLAPSYGSVVAFCGNAFFRALVEHKEVRESYLNTVSAGELRAKLPDEFSYGGVRWMRYRTTASARAAKGGADFLATDEARVCFEGVPDLYKTWFAPADYLDTVNRPGLPIYMRENEKARSNKSVSFEIQKNPLHVCTQPKTLRRLKLAA